MDPEVDENTKEELNCNVIKSRKQIFQSNSYNNVKNILYMEITDRFKTYLCFLFSHLELFGILPHKHISVLHAEECTTYKWDIC